MRLIDADALKDEFCAMMFPRDRMSVLRVIDKQPTIPAEHKHGRWIPLSGWCNRGVVKCSECGNTLDMHGVNAGRGDANFCPNCGSRMDGESKVQE